MKRLSFRTAGESHGRGLAGLDGGLQYTGQGLSLAELRLLAGELPRSEVERRLGLLAEHAAQYHTTNHVTPCTHPTTRAAVSTNRLRPPNRMAQFSPRRCSSTSPIRRPTLRTG